MSEYEFYGCHSKVSPIIIRSIIVKTSPIIRLVSVEILHTHIRVIIVDIRGNIVLKVICF